MNRRRRLRSSDERSRHSRAGRPLRPFAEGLEVRALLSADLDPRLLLVNKAGIGSFPSDFTAVGDTTYFVAGDLAHGRELYRTNGTVDGTRLVKDINPGPASSNIHDLTALNGLLLFFADDGSHGEELWRSDGTEDGTFILADVNSGPGGSAPATASAPNTTAVFEGKMFFAANDGVHGTELWATDGTSFGTSIVADINPGAGSSNPAALTVFNGKLYFQATAGAGGSQLFASDGTAAGTTLVKTLNPTGDAGPSDFTAFGGELYFAAADGTNGRQLWKTDGTPAGTVEVTVIPNNPNVRDLTTSGGALFFAADSGLWVSDGTANGTNLVAAVDSPSYLTPLKGKVVFSATTAGHAAQLWESDGTAAGTTMLTDIDQAGFGFEPAATRGNSESRFATLGGDLYFSASDGIAHGRQLWRSDGTAAGTTMVTDINPVGFGTNQLNGLGLYAHYLGSNTDRVAAVNGRLFFSADDGPDGSQLWTSRGLSSDTQMLARLATGTQTSNPTEGYVNVNGITFFDASDGIHGHELWRTDGTAAGTFLVKDIKPGPGDSQPHDLTRFDNKLIFTAVDGIGPNAHGREVWISDGTAAGTFMLKDINPGPDSSVGVDTIFTEVNGVMYFSASDGVGPNAHGLQLWRTDGTTAGTFMVADLNPGTHRVGRNAVVPNDSSPQFLTAFDGKLFFAATDRTHGSQLWVSDGTTQGTTPVTNIDAFGYNYGLYPQDLTVFKGHLFFSANDGVNGAELWESDGTTAGTFMLDDINSGPGSSSPANFTAVGDKLFFTADDGVHGRELWATDGTTVGTALVKDINPGPGSSFHNPSNYAIMANVDGVLLFSADDGAHGLELWRSDGTAAGTTPVRDINPGPGDGIVLPSAYSFTVIGGELFFAAADGVHGDQLWMSNGTPDGTQPVSTTLAFPDPVTLKPLADINGSLYFSANDGIHGLQTWIIPADQIEDLKDHKRAKHHEGDDQQEGRDPSGHDSDLGDRDAILTPALSPGQQAPVSPAALTSNGPSTPSGRGIPARLTAPSGGPLGPLGIIRSRVLQDLARSRRGPIGSLT
jgi:ELWxxDGT repeat protein